MNFIKFALGLTAVCLGIAAQVFGTDLEMSYSGQTWRFRESNTLLVLLAVAAVVVLVFLDRKRVK